YREMAVDGRVGHVAGGGGGGRLQGGDVLGIGSGDGKPPAPPQDSVDIGEADLGSDEVCQNMEQEDAVEAGEGKWQAGRVGAHNRPNRAAAFPNRGYVDPHHPQPGASRQPHCSTRSTADIEQVRIAWEVESTQESLDLPSVARRT